MEEGLGTSFLFGNVDKAGRLEGDVFDESEKRNLGRLSQIMGGGTSKMLNDLDKEARHNMDIQDYDQPPPSPMDNRVQ